MGVYSAFGVLFCFVLSVTLLLAFLSFGRSTPRAADRERLLLRAKGGRAMSAFLAGTVRFVIRRRLAILAVSAALSSSSRWPASRSSSVDANWLNDFRDSRAAQAIDALHGRDHGRGHEPRAALRRGRAGRYQGARGPGRGGAPAGLGRSTGSRAQDLLGGRHPEGPQPDLSRRRSGLLRVAREPRAGGAVSPALRERRRQRGPGVPLLGFSARAPRAAPAPGADQRDGEAGAVVGRRAGRATARGHDPEHHRYRRALAQASRLHRDQSDPGLRCSRSA